MARDYAKEIADALQAGNIGAVAALAYMLLGRVMADDERREKENNRKQRFRDKRRLETDEPDTTSGDGMRRDTTGHDVASESASSLTAKTTSTTPPTTAREALDFFGSDVSAGQLKPRMAAHWPSVLRFLNRRPVATWGGWTRAMLKCVAGEEFAPADLAQVCDDDEALTRPVGSPFVLRRFLVTMRTERTEDAASTTTAARPNGRRVSATQGGARNDAAIDRWLQKKEAEAANNGGTNGH